MRMMPMEKTTDKPQSGKTTYLVRVRFNPESTETLQDKLQRMLEDEVNHPDPAA